MRAWSRVSADEEGIRPGGGHPALGLEAKSWSQVRPALSRRTPLPRGPRRPAEASSWPRCWPHQARLPAILSWGRPVRISHFLSLVSFFFKPALWVAARGRMETKGKKANEVCVLGGGRATVWVGKRERNQIVSSSGTQ